MKKILLNGVDGNFGGKSAGILLEKYPHEDLIFTAPREKALKKYKEMGIETRVADFNHAETLVETFKGADTVVLISMPFVGPKRRAAHKTAIDAAVRAGVKKLVYTSIVGAGEKDINTYEVNDHVWTENYIKEQPIMEFWQIIWVKERWRLYLVTIAQQLQHMRQCLKILIKF